ncbi:Sensor histidine kinase YycG [compost metagenome]
MKWGTIFTKTFLYTLGLMLFLTVISHALFYLLTPSVSFSPKVSGGSLVQAKVTLILSDYTSSIIHSVLPVSMLICFVVSVICSILYSRAITRPIRCISAVAVRMAALERDARCKVQSGDEIGVLANNLNMLYQSLLSTIENFEEEKNKVSESEKSKVEFLRAASHELKTPVTALNAMLENMILGVGKYNDHGLYLLKCKVMTENLVEMIKNILDTSNLALLEGEEGTEEINLLTFLNNLCEPFRMIAKSKGIKFDLNLSDGLSVILPSKLFSKVLSNIISNAVSYTEQGKGITIYSVDDNLIIENECNPIPEEHLEKLFTPFYRLDYARDRNSGGNGLGLYIVDTILNTLQIKYDFMPTPLGNGMCFRLQLKTKKAHCI